jgi:hypothetical protein
MARYVVIAARNRPDLHSYLQRQFAEDNEAQVILDRRLEERRRREESHHLERRREERRGRRGKDLGLYYHGFLVVYQISQGSETKMQWRPPWWESGRAGDLVGLKGRQWPGETHVIESRDRLAVGVIEALPPLSAASNPIMEQRQSPARAETWERKYERLEAEIEKLRTENEQLKGKQREFGEILKKLARHLALSASGGL